MCGTKIRVGRGSRNTWIVFFSFLFFLAWAVFLLHWWWEYQSRWWSSVGHSYGLVQFLWERLKYIKLIDNTCHRWHQYTLPIQQEAHMSLYQHYLWSCDLTRGSHEYAATLPLAMRSNKRLTWVCITRLVVNYQFIIQWSFIYSLGLNHVYTKKKLLHFSIVSYVRLFNSVICLDFRYRHTNHTLGIIHTN